MKASSLGVVRRKLWAHARAGGWGLGAGGWIMSNDSSEGTMMTK